MITTRDTLWYLLGTLVTVISTVIGIKFLPTSQKPCPVASSPIPSAPAISSPVPSASGKQKIELDLREIEIRGHRSPSSLTNPTAKELDKVDYNCRCEDEGKSIKEMPFIHMGNVLISTTMSCHLGLLLMPTEGHPDHLYRNECRPQGKPLLKKCLPGDLCGMHDVEEGSLCEAKSKKVAFCKCGLILNYSSPALRGTVQRIHCDDKDEREPPSSPPPQCAPQSGSDSIPL